MSDETKPYEITDGEGLPTYLVDDVRVLNAESTSITNIEVDSEDPIVGVLSQTQETRPESTSTWYVNGPQGVSVRMQLEFIESNGHNHSAGTSDSRVVGRTNPSSFTLTGPWPQNVPVIYSATNFCGMIRISALASNGQVDVDYQRVRFPGLIRLPSHANIRSYTNDPTHPVNDYGLPKLVRAITNCADAFGREFPGQRLWVNDMSLPWGGVFDIRGSHTSPHQGHKWGGEVDISYNYQTGDQRKWFRVNAGRFFSGVKLHGSPAHWHCSIW